MCVCCACMDEDENICVWCEGACPCRSSYGGQQVMSGGLFLFNSPFYLWVCISYPTWSSFFPIDWLASEHLRSDSLYPSAGIIGTCCCARRYVGLGDPSSGPYVCTVTHCVLDPLKYLPSSGKKILNRKWKYFGTSLEVHNPLTCFHYKERNNYNQVIRTHRKSFFFFNFHFLF